MSRSIQSFALAVVITLTLIYTMNKLIEMAQPELGKKESFKLPDFVHVPKNETLDTLTPKPERPNEVQEQPDTPDIEVTPDRIDIDSSIGVGRVKVGINKNLQSLDSNDGEYLPIFRAPPRYPDRALSRGKCGWVDIEYTVTASGGTRDPFVIDSSSSMFEGAAKKAALKYKYKPRQRNGKPVESTGVGVRIRFEIDGENGCSENLPSKNK